MSSWKVCVVAVMAVGLTTGCGRKKAECKPEAHTASVQAQAPQVLDITKPQPLLEEARGKARSKWESEVDAKYGAEWAKWDNTRRKTQTCAAPEGQTLYTCEVQAAPCKARDK
jgi:hypothetical protein